MHSYFIVSVGILFVFIFNSFAHLQDYISNNIVAVAYICVILVILIIHAIAFYEYQTLFMIIFKFY